MQDENQEQKLNYAGEATSRYHGGFSFYYFAT